MIKDLDRKTDKLYKECGLGWFHPYDETLHNTQNKEA